MMTLDRDAAGQVLESFFDAIRKAIEAGIAEYDSLPSYQRILNTKRTRASAINDRMVHHALAELAPMDGVRVWESDGWIRFVISDTILLRFKKFTGTLNPASASTLQARLFVYQAQPIQLALPGLQMTNIIAGYRWDESETTFRIFLTCPDSPLENRWVIEIPCDFSTGTSSPPVPLPATPPPTHAGSKRIHVKPAPTEAEGDA